MNVLSLFDGISCGMLALEKAGIPVEKYFASEIDKYAIAVSNQNHKNIIQLGDIENWQEWDLPHIDIVMGGSPCQGFSNAGQRLNFDDPRSKLFFTFVDILQDIKPQYFLLENVRMKQEWQDIITDYMGVDPILIDSSLVSAQSRKRLYWTNIPDVTQPKDKNILLKDIIEHGFTDRRKSYTMVNSYSPDIKNYLHRYRHQIVFGCAHRRRYNENGDTYRKLELRKDEKGNHLTSFESKSLICICNDNNLYWRKLTPVEYERLQTIPDNYTLVDCPHFKNKKMSDSRRYKLLGNAWTVDVIAHILSNIKSN